MPRPEFPTGVIMTVEMIQRIRSDQDYYDRNPERAEREQKARDESGQEGLAQEEEYRRRQEEQ